MGGEQKLAIHSLVKFRLPVLRARRTDWVEFAPTGRIRCLQIPYRGYRSGVTAHRILFHQSIYRNIVPNLRRNVIRNLEVRIEMLLSRRL